MKRSIPIILAAFALVAQTRAAEPEQPTRKPNIVIILADDLGYADLGCQGSAEVRTPQIDSLAKNGVRFTAGYVSAPQCVPSRAGLMTGRDQNRYGCECNGDQLVLKGDKMMAAYLKEAGYVTGMVGKWHGHNPGDRPMDLGFDECFWNNGGGIINPDPQTGFLKNHLRNAEPVLQERECSTDAYGREAAAFIGRHAGGAKPFFLYLAFVPPHWPMEAKPEFMKQFAHIPDMHRRTMLAMMASLDENVGRVLAKVRETGQEERTLIFFLSDNGGPTGKRRPKPDAPFEMGQNTSRNDPFRGVKGELLEGGIRIPFLAQWKGIIPAGIVYEQPVISFDIAATALALSGVTAQPPLDGVNLIPRLTSSDTTPPHDTLFWRFRFPPSNPDAYKWAIRRGQWKLVKNGHEPLALYDLSADLGEKDNHIGKQPELAKELQTAWDRWNTELKDSKNLGRPFKSKKRAATKTPAPGTPSNGNSVN